METLAIQINHNELIDFVKLSYKTNRPLFVHGGIGLGKSDSICQAAKDLAKDTKREFLDWNRISLDQKRDLIKPENVEKAFIFADVRASQLEPSDLKGIPDLNGHGETKRDFLEWKPQLLFRILSNPKAKGLIFLDEFNQAIPSVQNSLFQLILDNEIGDLALSDGIIRIAAGNRTSDKSSIFDMPMPLANRFCHVELKVPDIDTWTEWALKNACDTRIIAYLNYKPEAIYRFDSQLKSKAFCSPRSWYFASQLIKDNNPNTEHDWDFFTKIVSSAIGEGTALEFVAFSRLKQKIDIDKLIANPQSIEDIEEIDLLYSVISGIAEKYRKNNKVFSNCLEICRYLKSEFAILLLHLIKGIDPTYWMKQTATMSNKTWNELATKYRNYLLK